MEGDGVDWKRNTPIIYWEEIMKLSVQRKVHILGYIEMNLLIGGS